MTQSRRKEGQRHFGLLASSALVLSLALAAPGARAQSVASGLSAPQRFSIPEGPLPAALARFSEVGGMQLLYPAELARGLRTGGVSGQLAPQQALTQLLAGTGLTWRMTAPVTAH